MGRALAALAALLVVVTDARPVADPERPGNAKAKAAPMVHRSPNFGNQHQLVAGMDMRFLPGIPQMGSAEWHRMCATIRAEGMSMREGLEIRSWNSKWNVRWP